MSADAAGREVVGEALGDRELLECEHGFGYVPCSHGCDLIIEALAAHRLSEFDRDNDQHPCPEPCEWKWSPRDIRDRELGYQARRRQHDVHVAAAIAQALADRAQTDEAGLRTAVDAVLAKTEWYCDDDHEWDGRRLLTDRIRAALAAADQPDAQEPT